MPKKIAKKAVKKTAKKVTKKTSKKSKVEEVAVPVSPTGTVSVPKQNKPVKPTKNTKIGLKANDDGKSGTVVVSADRDAEEGEVDEDGNPVQKKKSYTVYGGLKPRAVEDNDNDL